MPEYASVTVLVSPELISELDEWSEPVRVKVNRTPGHQPGYEMIATNVLANTPEAKRELAAQLLREANEAEGYPAS